MTPRFAAAAVLTTTLGLLWQAPAQAQVSFTFANNTQSQTVLAGSDVFFDVDFDLTTSDPFQFVGFNLDSFFSIPAGADASNLGIDIETGSFPVFSLLTPTIASAVGKAQIGSTVAPGTYSGLAFISYTDPDFVDMFDTSSVAFSLTVRAQPQQPTAIPEPGTLTLLGLAAFSPVAARLRRRAK